LADIQSHIDEAASLLGSAQEALHLAKKNYNSKKPSISLYDQ
jgi:hypothetical protein